ncbi:hypothetical protein MTO98_17700 [Mucilaginibacter sp. SMC90]|uniref:hypothetical protein n=1 Tax=Mucilaginibacter sp. SMC90 TaxID=2929803 RepID=UPI001FB343CA|nr:hypothetical protein [Mucilaginibacter sp. SMC90]UOE46237.1 hypothetical protein MTO98_17700 [Mucilaginibacter sp. SMC90]
MSNINFDELYQQLQTNVISIAKASFQSYFDQAKSDGELALENMKENLQTWTAEVQNGSLTTDDLAFLLKGEEGLNEMLALKQAGLAEVQIDRFKQAIINLVVGTVTSLIKV